MVISAFIGLVGLGPASSVFTFHLLDSLLTTTTNISICPHMTSYSNTSSTITTIQKMICRDIHFPLSPFIHSILPRTHLTSESYQLLYLIPDIPRSSPVLRRRGWVSFSAENGWCWGWRDGEGGRPQQGCDRGSELWTLRASGRGAELGGIVRGRGV